MYGFGVSNITSYFNKDSSDRLWMIKCHKIPIEDNCTALPFCKWTSKFNCCLSLFLYFISTYFPAFLVNFTLNLYYFLFSIAKLQNSFGGKIDFNCGQLMNKNSYLAGLYSEYRIDEAGGLSDRLWRFECCESDGMKLGSSLILKGKLENTQSMWLVPNTTLHGIRSEYNKTAKDRGWSYIIKPYHGHKC